MTTQRCLANGIMQQASLDVWPMQYAPPLKEWIELHKDKAHNASKAAGAWRVEVLEGDLVREETGLLLNAKTLRLWKTGWPCPCDQCKR
jgi:hypothetical protein